MALCLTLASPFLFGAKLKAQAPVTNEFLSIKATVLGLEAGARGSDWGVPTIKNISNAVSSQSRRSILIDLTYKNLRAETCHFYSWFDFQGQETICDQCGFDPECRCLVASCAAEDNRVTEYH
jgi:hypothetical protein